MFLLTKEYTSYPGEKEVLIQDGLEYRVIQKITKEHDGKPYELIKLEYPPGKNKSSNTLVPEG